MLITIPEGTVVLKEGETNDSMYKILSGNAEVYAGYGTASETVLGILSAGSYFGELGLLTGKPSIYTIVAFSDLILNRITMNEIDDYMAKNHHDMLAILTNMANTMFNLKFNLDLQLKELEKLSGEKERPEDKGLVSRQLLRYHIQGISAARNTFDNRG